MLGWFGVDRSRSAIRNWCQSFAESHEQAFTAEPDRVAVDEKQVQLAEEREMWLYALVIALGPNEHSPRNLAC